MRKGGGGVGGVDETKFGINSIPPMQLGVAECYWSECVWREGGSALGSMGTLQPLFCNKIKIHFKCTSCIQDI